MRVTALLLGQLTGDEAAALRREMERDPALKLLHDRLHLTIGLVREASAGARTLAVGTWLDLDTLHENTRWPVPLPPPMANRPAAAAERGPHHDYAMPGSTISSPQEQAS